MLHWFPSKDRHPPLGDLRTVTAGVPQGSILGPLLFVLFINDLPLNVHTRIDMFADDTTLLASSDYLNVEELKNTL